MQSEINVLLVEDEQRDAAFIVRQIERAGYKVQHTVVDTPEGLQIALQSSKWDIIISDYNIPGFGGPQALAVIKRINADIPFILISGNVGEDIAVKIIKDGASDYLMKDNLVRLGTVIKNELAAADSKKDRLLLDKALNQISTAIASSNIDNFLQTILLQLSSTLHADYAFIGLYKDQSERLEILCMCEDGKITGNKKYPVKYSPSEEVLQNKIVFYQKDISVFFPGNENFLTKKIEGYIGVPLNNAAGNTIGTMELLYKKPVQSDVIKQSILRLYSSRIAAEIERSQFTQALKESEQRFAAIFKNSPVGISLTSIKDGVFYDVNDIFLEKTGYTREEVIGKGAVELNLYRKTEDRDFIRDSIIKYGAVTNREYEFTGKHGNSFFCLISISVVNINGIAYMLSSIIDINDRKVAIDKLLESEAKVSAYFNSTTEAIVMVDSCGKLMVYNKVYESYVNKIFKKQVAAGDEFKSYTQPGQEAIFAANITSAMAGGTANIELQLPYFNGEKKWVAISFVAVKNETDIIGVAINHTDINDRKKAEEKLRRSEYNLNTAQRLSKMGSWEFNPATGNLLWSDELYEIFDVDKEAGQELYDAYFKRLHPDETESIIKLLEAGKDYTLEHRAVMPDGTIKYIDTAGEFVKDEHGNVLLIRGTAQDITDRKKVENQLTESENKLAAYFNSTSDVIILVSPDYAVLAFNKVCENMVWKNYNKQIVIGDSVLEYFNSNLADALKRNFNKALAGEVLTVETEIVFPDKIAWHRIVYNPVFNKSGDIIGVAFNSADISDVKFSEKILRDSEIKFRSMVHNISDIITLVDINGIILYQSASIKNVLGYEEDETTGKSIFDFTHPEETPFVLNQLQEIITTGSGLLVDFRFLNKAGTYVLLEAHTNNQLNNPAINAIVLNSRDITQRKNAEAALMKQAHDLAVSNIELERFAYVASHDLQEPLRMVNSFMTLLQKKYEDQLDITANKYIRYAVEGSLRMKQLINDLLLYSRVGNQGQAIEAVNLLEVTENVKEALANDMVLNGSFIQTKNLPVVPAIKLEMHQLMQNLIDNAIKYQHKGNKAIIYVEGEDKDKYWLISIKDNGIGIDPTFKEKIFVVFQRLHNKDAFSGTGIGLPVCKKIVEKTGGKIWVESELGKGSTFFFTIPK